MIHAYHCSLVAMREDVPGSSRPRWKTIYAFIFNGDEGSAQFAVGQAADAWVDATGEAVNWHVDVLPSFNDTSVGQLMADVRMASEG